MLDQAQHALEAVGLADRADEIARALSHREQRQLEIAICRATLPELLLLDEPLSGNGGGRIDEDDRVIRRLSREHDVLLVEHDMDAVFQLTHILTVIVNGKGLAGQNP